MLGTRFYKFISDDEFTLVTLVHQKENKGIFMDEETFETFEITNKELDRYTMLSDNKVWAIFKYKLKKEFNDGNIPEYVWLCNDDHEDFKKNQMVSLPYKFDMCINMRMYKYVTKSVFEKMLNYIIQLNTLNNNLTQEDIDSIWETYFKTYVNDSILVLDITEDFGEILPTIEDKLPDAVIDEAEICLNTAIMAYAVYQYDISVDLSKIGTKYFLLYLHDKYYIVTYTVDTKRETYEMQQNLKDCEDVVSFMLK